MKTKTVKFQELEVGDWFRLKYIRYDLFVTNIDKDNNKLYVSSPAYLANSEIDWVCPDMDEYTLIGKSKPNIWYKIFFKFDLICPVKRIPLK